MLLLRPLSRYALLPLFCMTLLLVVWLTASLPSSLVFEKGGSIPKVKAVPCILFPFLLFPLWQLLIMRFSLPLNKLHLYHFIRVKVPRSRTAKIALFLLGGVLPAVGIAFLGLKVGRIWKQQLGTYGIPFYTSGQPIFYLTLMLVIVPIINTSLYLNLSSPPMNKKWMDHPNFLRFLFHIYERVYRIYSTSPQSLPLFWICSGGMALSVLFIYNSIAQPVQITCGVFAWCALAALMMRRWGKGLPKMHPWYPVRSYALLGVLFLALLYLQIRFSFGEPPSFEEVHLVVATMLGGSLPFSIWVPLFSYPRHANKKSRSNAA